MTSQNWFEGNDQDLYERLLLWDANDDDGTTSKSTMEQELTQSLTRLQNDYFEKKEDSNNNGSYWQTLIQQVQNRGFSVPVHQENWTKKKGMTSPPPDSSCPAAFETSLGKAHVKALQSYLHLSSSLEAIQITLGSLSATLTTTTTTTDNNNANSSTSTNNNKNLQSLLGTSTLFVSCVQYHGHQRIARLQILMELLRRHAAAAAEDEPSSSSSSLNTTQLLQPLDSTHSLGDNHTPRGLWALLIVAATSTSSRNTTTTTTFQPPSRQTLQPLIHLLSMEEDTKNNHHHHPHHSTAAAAAQQHNQHRHPIIQQTWRIQQLAKEKEQLEALETLLVLWYTYYPSITRVDYAMWIIAIQDASSNPSSLSNPRFTQLAGLISLEGFSLWKATTTTISGQQPDDPNWVMQHPFLEGLFLQDSSVAERELQALQTLLMEQTGLTLSSMTMTMEGIHNNNTNSVPTAAAEMIPRMDLNSPSTNAFVTTPTTPQGLVPYSTTTTTTTTTTKPPSPLLPKEVSSLMLLGWGLLQKLAYQALLLTPLGGIGGSSSQAVQAQSQYWYNLDSIGMSNIQTASDTLEAFSVLHTVMEALVVTNKKNSGESETTTEAAIVAYASIGREVLVATIATFCDTLLHIHHPGAQENIGMLCHLTSVVYQNIPVLCQQFWNEWDFYSLHKSSNNNNGAGAGGGDPLCYLMEAAYSLAIAALNAASKLPQQQIMAAAGLEEDLISKLEPLLILVSALVSSGEDVDSILQTGILPEGMIRTALVCCCSMDTTLGEDVSQCARGIVQSISNLIRMSTSSTPCSSFEIAKCLEEEQHDPQQMQQQHRPDGPRILYRIITTNNDPIIVTAAFDMMADLLMIVPKNNNNTWVEGTTTQSSSWLVSLWPLAAARFFISSSSWGGGGGGDYPNTTTTTTTMDSSGFAKYVSTSHDTITLAVLQVLNGFVHQLSSVAFQELPHSGNNNNGQQQQQQQQQHYYEEIVTYMQTIVQGTMVSCRVLSSMISLAATNTSNTTNASSGGGGNFEMAHVVLDILSTLWKSLRPIATLHTSPLVRSTALESQQLLLTLMETQTILGETVAYFALAPISLGLASNIDSYLQEAQLLSLTSSQDENVNSGNHTTTSTAANQWKHLVKSTSTTTPHNNDLPSLVMTHIQGLLSNISSLSLENTQAWSDRGWIHPSQKGWIQKAACSAMEVLLGWAFTARDNHHIMVPTTTATETSSFGGPGKLLTSLASLPPPIRDEGMLASFWPRTTLSNLTLLMRYLPSHNKDETSPTTTTTISLLALQIIRVCLGGSEEEEQPTKPSLMSMALGKTTQFYQIVSESFKNNNNHNKQNVDDKIDLLQILCIAAVTNGQIVRSLQDDATTTTTPIIQPLVDTVCDIVSCMTMYSSSNDSNKATSADRIRLGASCLDVLWALWNATPPNNNGGTNTTNANHYHIRQKVVVGSDNNKFLSTLVQIVMSPISIQIRQQRDEGDDSSDDLLPKSVLVNLVSKALDILSVEMVASLHEASASTGLWGLLQSELNNNNASLSATSKHCTKLEGALTLSKVWSSFSTELEKISQSSNLLDMNALVPTDVLFAFPTVAGNMQQTTCHIKDASTFFTNLGGTFSSMANLDASYTLLSKELSLISAWKKFAQVYTLIMKRNTSSSPSPVVQDSLALAHETLAVLYQNVNIIELAHVTTTTSSSSSSNNFFAADASHMACELSELLLHSLHHYVELSSNGSESSMALPSSTSTDLLTDMLSQLQEASDKLFSTLGQAMASSSTAAHFGVWSSAPSLGGKLFNTFCVLQHRLLTSATILVTLAESNPPPSTPRSSTKSKQRRNQCLVLLARLACKALSLLESGRSQHAVGSSEASITNVTYRELLHSCVSLLTLLVSTNNAGSAIDREYYAKLASTLQESDAITSLVREAGNASTMAVSALSVRDSSTSILGGGDDEDTMMQSASEVAIGRHDHDIAVSIVRSIFMLASTIADIGDKSPEMLSLLTNSGFSELIVSNPLLRYASEQWTFSAGTLNAAVGHPGGSGISSGGVGRGIQSPRQLRGYLPADSRSVVGSQKSRQARESGRNCFAGKDDPIHEVWRTTIHILATALRSSSQLLGIENNAETLNQTFILMALDFLGTHEASLRACLSECSSVAFGDTNQTFSSARHKSSSATYSSSVFTMNLLRETCNILTLLSELCTGTNRNQFERDSPKLYSRFVQASLEVTGALSNFLGAAGAARELFKAISDIDSSGTEGIPADINPLLFGGIPNARHEAIRNADFVNSCCAVVTTEDYDASINSVSASVSVSTGNKAERLEQRCKMIVNSDFVLGMEHSGGECLFQALAVLWKTHPSSSCFVVFTPEEAARLDSMSLVKSQMIIGLRPSVNQGSGSFSSMVGDSTTGGNAISFARVLDSDTVSRQWYVEYLDDNVSSRKREIVGSDRLAGVEDVMKRKCIFEYDAANFVYESAGMSKSKVTLGHLILALRWCHQHMTRPNDGYHSVVKCLAERATVLLGAEVALHEEIGTAKQEVGQVSMDLVKRVNAQLLDLFEDVDKDQHYDTSRLGRLKTVIDDSTWNAIQRQLSREMIAARNDREEEQKKNVQQTHGVASSGSPYRRAGLFRGVSF